MADSDKSDTQELILKQFKLIKIALWTQMVMIVLLTEGIALGGGFIVYYADLAERGFFRDANREATAPQDMEAEVIQSRHSGSERQRGVITAL